MVYVHLVKNDIQGSIDEVWDLLGPNFVDVVEWSSKYNECRTLKEYEIPPKFHPSKNHKYVRNAPVRGRVVNNPLVRGDKKQAMAQTITYYSDERKEFTFSCSYPLPMVESYECTVIVAEQEKGRTDVCTVEIECDFRPVVGFCWLAELLQLKEKLKEDPRGPAGDLEDIKLYFQRKRQMEERQKIPQIPK